MRLAFTIQPTSPDDWVRLAGDASETRASPGALARRAGHPPEAGALPFVEAPARPKERGTDALSGRPDRWVKVSCVSAGCGISSS